MVSRWYDALGRFAQYTGPIVASFIVEFIGTFFLVLTIGLQTTEFAPIAIGSALMVMIFMGGHISGAHYNPAVTLGVRLTGRDHITTSKALIYVVLQLLAGFVGAGVAYGLTDNTFAPVPARGVNLARVFFVEFLYTFALVSVMLNTATTKSQNSNSFFGLAIGFTVLAGAYSAGPISGGAFNPAVVLGPTVINAVVNQGEWKYFPLYWLAHILASTFASIIFRMTNTAEYRHNAAIADASAVHEKDGYSKINDSTSLVDDM